MPSPRASMSRRSAACGTRPASSPGRAWAVAPSEMLPTTSATATRPSRASSRHRVRGRTARKIPGSTLLRAGRAAVTLIRPPPPVDLSWPRPLQPEPDLADLDLVAVAERCDGFHGRPVDERPVGAAEVFHVPVPTPVRQRRMLPRRKRVVDHDRVVHVPPDRGDGVEAEDRADRRFTGRRLDDDEPPEFGSVAGCRPEVAQEDPDDRKEEQVEQPEEDQPDDPDREREAIHARAGSAGQCLHDQHGVADLDPVARSERDLVDPETVDPGPVRAPEVGVDKGAASGLEPPVVARDPRVDQDERVVPRPSDREDSAVDFDRPVRAVGPDLAENGPRTTDRWSPEHTRLVRIGLL